jgi:hypothetical protein
MTLRLRSEIRPKDDSSRANQRKVIHMSRARARAASVLPTYSAVRPPAIGRTVMVETQRHSRVANAPSPAKDVAPVAKEASPAEDASPVVSTAKADTKKASITNPKCSPVSARRTSSPHLTPQIPIPSTFLFGAKTLGERWTLRSRLKGSR